MAPLLALLGARLGGAGLEGTQLVELIVGWFLLGFAVFVVNDCFDAAIDAIVDPTRPIPSGRISPAMAGGLAATVGLTGVGLLGLVAPALGLVGALYAAISWFYSARLKQLQGALANATVAGLIALVPLSSFAAGASAPPGWLAPAIFLGVLAREVLNDIEDLAGDRVAGRPTLPVLIGSRAAFRLSAALWVGFVIAAWWPAVATPPRPLGYHVATISLSAASLALAAQLVQERVDLLPRLQRWSKLLLVLQVVLMLISPEWYVSPSPTA